jgi:hypothetical protein
VPAVVQQLQAQTPYNLAQLEHQFARLKDCISRRSQSPPSPTDLVLDQLIKGGTIAMASTTLYAADNERLREMEERKKSKKQQKTRQFSKATALTVAEAREMFQISKKPNKKKVVAKVVAQGVDKVVDKVVDEALNQVISTPKVVVERAPHGITCYICK